MANIVPVSELAYNTNRISKICHDKAEPVYLTKDGYGDMVVLSIEQYDLLVARSQAYLANARAGHVKADPHLMPESADQSDEEKNSMIKGGIEKLPIDEVKDILEDLIRIQKQNNPGYRKRFP
jgi:hypothetical protein